MSLRLESELRNQIASGEIPLDSTQLTAALRLIADLEKYREQYGEVRVSPDNPESPQFLLLQAIAEYKIGIRTAEMWTNYWRAKYQVAGAKSGLDLKVPDCDWSDEEIGRPMVDIRGNKIPGIMVPVIPAVTLAVLRRMYPGMQSGIIREDSPIQDTHNTSGWIKVYGSVVAPNRSTTWSEVKKFTKAEGYLLGREKTYILGGQASHDLQGKYFDQGATISMNPGSLLGGRPVYSNFHADGRLFAHRRLLLEVAAPFKGWRFEEVRKA